MSDAILHDIRIVDLSTGIAGPVAAMVLAEAGADVILVEPPGGHPDRSKAGFRTWARSKRSVALDIDDPSDRARLDELLASADVLVHSFTPTAARQFGLDDVALAGRFPDLIVSSALGWPANHPDADLPVDDTLTLARLGICDEQVGPQGHSPIFVRFPLGSWGAAWLGAIGIVARLVSRWRSGVAGPAHTSLVQGALIPMMMHWSRAQNPPDMLRIGMPKGNMQATLFECGDGQWIHVMPPTPDALPFMREAIDALGADGVATANATQSGGLAMWPNAGAYRVAFKTRPAQEWLEHYWANDVPAQAVLPIGGILHDEQARANGYVVDLDDPVAGRITVAGMPLTIDPPAAIRGTAPAAPGEHTAAVLGDLARRPVQPRALRLPHTRTPLDRVKVLDFGNFLAGPLGPMLLADLGADVVKVEATTGDPMRFPDWAFAGCQRGKRGVALDLKNPASRPAVEALVRWADVVHHNLRMPAARRLGLDPDSLRQINPDIVFCHTSSYGPTGPRADWPGYDQLFQSSCGWELEGAGEGNPPMWHRFGFMDHMCAMSSVVSTLLALYHRDRTGLATDVAGSLLGAGVMTTSETYLQPDGELAPLPRLDADQTHLAPGVRIAQVSDGWVAVAAHRPDEVDRLLTVAGCESADRLPHALSTRGVEELLGALAAADVPAGVLRLDQRDAFFDDADNRTAGLVAEYRHGAWGNFVQPGSMWYFGDQGTQLHRAPPLLGEHTVEVLRQVGLYKHAIDELIKTGAAYDWARDPDHAEPADNFDWR